MPSKERYARQKAAAAAAGTTPYKQRIATERKRAPGLPLAALRGHAEGPQTLGARRERREERAAAGAGPDGFCVVCGSQVEDGRPNSYSDRICGNEQVKRYRRDGERWASFRGLELLARDGAWVSMRREQSETTGVPLRQPRGVVLA